MNDMKLSISPGNSKIGKTANISLPPHTTCIEDAPCRRDCYAYNHAYVLYPQTRAAWNRNLDVWVEDQASFEMQILNYLKKHKPAYFRWHVGGDIPDRMYAGMIRFAAHEFPETEFLIYTRRNWLDDHTYDNLSVMRSQWIGEDVYTLRRKFIVLEKGADVPLDGLLCPGKCDENCRACWRKVTNRPIYIHKH